MPIKIEDGYIYITADGVIYVEPLTPENERAAYEAVTF